MIVDSHPSCATIARMHSDSRSVSVSTRATEWVLSVGPPEVLSSFAATVAMAPESIPPLNTPLIALTENCYSRQRKSISIYTADQSRSARAMRWQLLTLMPQLSVTTTEAPLAFFLIESIPFMQASLDL